MDKHEKKFYEWLRPYLPGHYQRIETTTGSGVPDLNVCYLGTETWVELKAPLDGKVLLRKEQYAWMKRRCHDGGRCIVMARTEGYIAVWYMDNISVHSYGKSCKYVQVTSSPDFSTNGTGIGEFLKTILFTSKQ